MARLCAEDHIAMTPYSALAGGRLSRHPGEVSSRLEKDSYAKFKYDATAKQDNVIIRRVEELAEKRDVSVTEISLAWLLTKVTAPVVGAVKMRHIEVAAKAVDLILTPEEIDYLEEAYVPHRLVGVMAQNTPAAAKEALVSAMACTMPSPGLGTRRIFSDMAAPTPVSIMAVMTVRSRRKNRDGAEPGSSGKSGSRAEKTFRNLVKAMLKGICRISTRRIYLILVFREGSSASGSRCFAR